MKPSWRIFRHIGLILASITACAASLADGKSGKQPNAKGDDIVTLDKFLVSAAKFEWSYAKSSHFEILSSYDNSNFVAQVIQRAEQIMTAFDKNVPVLRLNVEMPVKIIFIDDMGIRRFLDTVGKSSAKKQYPAPSAIEKISGDYRVRPVWCQSIINNEQIVILCTITQDYMKNTHLSQTIKTMEYAHDIATTYFRNCFKSQGISLDTVFTKPFNRASMYNGRMWSTLAAPDHFPDLGIDAKHRAECAATSWIVIFRNIIHVARYVSGDYIMITASAAGYIGNHNPENWDEVKSTYIQNPHIPLGAILESKSLAKSPVFGSPAEVFETYYVFNREAIDFAFYCVFGPNLKTREAFVELALSAEKRPVTENIFKEYFGTGYDQFQKEIYAYYRSLGKGADDAKNPWGSAIVPIYRYTDETNPKPPVFKAAVRGQSARIISDWFALNNSQDKARQTLLLADEDAHTAAMRDPDFAAALGISEAQYGDKAKAISLLERATDAHVVRPEAYRALSKLRLENILATKGRDYRLTASEIVSIYEPLNAALKQPQSTPKTFLQIIDLWNHTNLKPQKEFLETLASHCARLFPDDFTLLDQLIPFLLRCDLKDTAAKVLAVTARCVLTADEQKHLEQLKATVTAK